MDAACQMYGHKLPPLCCLARRTLLKKGSNDKSRVVGARSPACLGLHSCGLGAGCLAWLCLLVLVGPLSFWWGLWGGGFLWSPAGFWGSRVSSGVGGPAGLPFVT